MEFIRNFSQLRPRHQGCVATIGNFDGVHLGHQAVINKARELARKKGAKVGVITFYPHPVRVIAPKKSHVDIMTLNQRLEVLELQGLDFVVVYTFTREFAGLSPDEFFDEKLVEQLKVRGIVVGSDFLFGRGRKGNGEYLRLKGRGRGIEVIIVSDRIIDNKRVSSSAIRKLLMDGMVWDAMRLLGRPYFIDGIVVEGDKRGRTIDFPTANLFVEQDVVINSGVYAAILQIEGSSKIWPAAVHYGPLPTVDKAEYRVEAHIIGFKGDCYGKKIRVWFLKKLRDLERFSSLQELKDAISRDVENTSKIYDEFNKKQVLPLLKG